MKPFFASLALRIKKGQSGLTGNEITFETEGCAQDLKTALNELGISCAVIRVGRQHKVRLSNPAVAETGEQLPWQSAAGNRSPETTPLEPPDPVATQEITETSEPSKSIPSLVLKGSEPASAGLPTKEKRRRFAELARQENLETGRKLEQSQLEFSISPARKAARKGRKG
ncbi:MAG TPA: hypothetical protein VGD78_10890 [Chthoniobacterales bacterium]